MQTYLPLILLCDTVFRYLEKAMSASLSEDEISDIKTRVIELKLEHRDLNQLIEQLVRDPSFEELHIKRLKKRKLQVKDELARLENKLIPDILA